MNRERVLHGWIQLAARNARRFTICPAPNGYAVWFEYSRFGWRPLASFTTKREAIEFACRECAKMAEVD